MKGRTAAIPPKPKIETEQVPVEWLHTIAVREGNSKKPIYCIHKWWARRLGSVFRTLIILAMTPSHKRMDHIVSAFYGRQDFADLALLDPFMGGGTSIVEASKCGAMAIGVDIDPVAWFVTKKEIDPCPVEEVEAALHKLDESVGSEIRSYYITRVPGGGVAPVIYYFWVDLVTCPDCAAEFEAHLHYQLCRDRAGGKQTVFCRTCHSIDTVSLSETVYSCPECGAITEIRKGTVRLGRFTCPECEHRASLLSAVGADGPRPRRFFAVEYEVEDAAGALSRAYKAADAGDLALFDKAQRQFQELEAELPFPREQIPVVGREDPRPVSHGYRYYHQLFNDRQLLCLSLLYRAISDIGHDEVREYLLTAFSDSLSTNNMLCSYAFDYRRLTPLFGLHAFNVVSRPVENNVWGGTKKYGRGSFLACAMKMLRGKRYAERPYEMQYRDGKPKRVYTGEKATAQATTDVDRWYHREDRVLLLNRSSTELGELRDDSIDLVLTDPPYYDNLAYSELSDFFYVWLRDHLPRDARGLQEESTPYLRALYARANSDPSHKRFVRDLTRVFAHCSRLLKPGGLMVFTFHHRDLEAWAALAKALLGAGFLVTNVFPLRSEGNSGFHSTSGTIKWDSVLVCRVKERDSGGAGPGYLRSVKAALRRWQRRLRKAEISFGWADSLSLGYALAVQGAVARGRSVDELGMLLEEAARALQRDGSCQPT